MKKINLKDLGLDEKYIEEGKKFNEDFHLGRVSVQNKNIYHVLTEEGEILAEVSGKYRHEVLGLNDYPAVGDWVLVDRTSNLNGNGIIHHLIPRRSSFERKVAGTRYDNQVVAANIDTIFICMSLNNNFNVRRLERYISVAFESNSKPVIVLTKSDLCFDLEEKISQVKEVAEKIDIIVTSSLMNEGYEEIKRYVFTGQTIAFIGSSGVGKSTMINKLLGSEELKTTEVGSEDKGRHTTTSRQLFLVEGGGILIDTPGIRELGLMNADLNKTFEDVEELERQCKFSDCSHNNVKGCAFKKAIDEGLITEERLNNYLKLKKELKYAEKKIKSREKKSNLKNEKYKNKNKIIKY